MAAPTLRNALWDWAHANGYPRQNTAAECQITENDNPLAPKGSMNANTGSARLKGLSDRSWRPLLPRSAIRRANSCIPRVPQIHPHTTGLVRRMWSQGSRTKPVNRIEGFRSSRAYVAALPKLSASSSTRVSLSITCGVGVPVGRYTDQLLYVFATEDCEKNP